MKSVSESYEKIFLLEKRPDNKMDMALISAIVYIRNNDGQFTASDIVNNIQHNNRPGKRLVLFVLGFFEEIGIIIRENNDPITYRRSPSGAMNVMSLYEDVKGMTFVGRLSKN